MLLYTLQYTQYCTTCILQYCVCATHTAGVRPGRPKIHSGCLYNDEVHEVLCEQEPAGLTEGEIHLVGLFSQNTFEPDSLVSNFDLKE